jgi:short-subunit dehydrogenase
MPAAATALVTGASTDTGYHIARRLCAHGHPVILVTAVEGEADWIAAELLLHGANVRAMTCDIESGFGPQQVFDELAEDGVRIEIIANNTGLVRGADCTRLPIERHLSALRIDGEVARGLTALLMPGMIERGHGQIVNLLSATRYTSTALRSACAASNALMLSWSDALAAQTADTPVNVTAFVPRISTSRTLAKDATPYAIACAAYDERGSRERCIVVGTEAEPTLPLPAPVFEFSARDQYITLVGRGGNPASAPMLQAEAAR